MDEIAAEAGFTKPIIYRTLGDKSAVAAAVSDHFVAEIDRLTIQSTEGRPRTVETLRFAVRAFFEVIERDRDVLLFVERVWGNGDGSDLDRLIERAAEPYVVGFADSPAVRDQPEWRRHTWAVATVGVLRVTARIWSADPYCTLDEVVDDAVTVIVNMHRWPPPHR